MSTLILTAPQWSVFCSQARFRVLAAGRRFGKTFLAMIELVRYAWKDRNRLVWYISPSYRQSKQILWILLKRHIYPYITSVNETDLSLRLRNGSVIALKGADNADSLRGVGLHFVVFDEAADIASSVWPEVIRPALSDTQGEALFISSPKSFNWFYDLFLLGQGDMADWCSWQYTTAQGGNVTVEEIEAARSIMGEAQFAQEFLASFTALSGRVYKSFERQREDGQGNMSLEAQDRGEELFVGMDFNVSPMSACVGQKVADGLHIFDEIELMNSDTHEMTMEIKRRYPNRSVAIYPDPSGASRHSSSVGQTDFTILRQSGFAVRAPRTAPPVSDRINQVNALCRSANGHTRLKIHPRCKKLIKCLEGLSYKEGTSIVDKSSGLDHMVDGLGYLISVEFPIVMPTTIVRFRA